MALSEGWEASDLTRALVILAASVTWLALEKKEKLKVLKEIALLGRIRQITGTVLYGSAKTPRPYNIERRSPETEVITLILPLGVAELLESFGGAKAISKSDLCGGLLTKGLILYATAESTLLQTLQSLRRETEGLPAGPGT